jgi:very-short-patch-repair endonuclease
MHRPCLQQEEGNTMRGKTNHARERRLRRDQTEAERVLWQHLRDRRLLGCKFRRQHRIGPYFADFACVEAMLVVELDGSQHLAQRRHDDARTRFLEARGFRVRRFWNDEVLRDTTDVLHAIIAALAPHPPFGLLLPATQGEGETFSRVCEGTGDAHGVRKNAEKKP